MAVGLYGLSFGALSVAAGLDLLSTMALSALMFTGGSQFAYIGVISGGGAPAAAVGAASLLGIRNCLYGVQLNAMLQPRGLMRPVMAHFTIDESMANATAQEDPGEQRRGFWAAGVAVFVFWNLATLVGALAGERIGDPKIYGLDGAALAAFLGLLWPRLRGREPIAVAVACGAATALVTPVLPPGLPIIVSAVVAAGMVLIRRRGGRG